jgi:hypothetical protein
VAAEAIEFRPLLEKLPVSSRSYGKLHHLT